MSAGTVGERTRELAKDERGSEAPRNRVVYISFLGTGFYDEVQYRWKDVRLNPTPYAQEAELVDILANAPPDVVLIFGTATSKAAHWEAQRGYSAKSKTFGNAQGPGLGPRLSRYTPEFVQISEALSPAHQWGTFEELLKRIHDGDELIFDMTHGFRAVPVVFSSAMHFLRLTRNIKLRHVFYGAHDSDPPEIVDYRDFYAVQDWTEAVSRLVDDADASKLAALASDGGALSLLGKDASALAQSLAELTAAVRDVDLQQVGPIANRAIATIQAAEAEATGAGKVLLGLVQDKFAALATMGPSSGRYDAQYFAVQRELIGLLLQHGLAMQAYTAMSEYIASLGLHEAGGLGLVKDHRGRRHADVFGVMVEVDPEVSPWRFDKERSGYQTTLEPWYARLEREGLLRRLRAVATAIKPVRNGFAHGWTGRVRDGQDVARCGRDALGQLEQITLEINELIGGLHDSTAVARGGR